MHVYDSGIVLNTSFVVCHFIYMVIICGGHENVPIDLKAQDF